VRDQLKKRLVWREAMESYWGGKLKAGWDWTEAITKGSEGGAGERGMAGRKGRETLVQKEDL